MNKSHLTILATLAGAILPGAMQSGAFHKESEESDSPIKDLKGFNDSPLNTIKSDPRMETVFSTWNNSDLQRELPSRHVVGFYKKNKQRAKAKQAKLARRRNRKKS